MWHKFKLCILIPQLFWFNYPVKAQKNSEIIQLMAAGKEYYVQEQYFSAIEYFEEVLKKNPGHEEALFKLGECFRYLFEFEKAEKYYQELISLQSKINPLVYYYHSLMLKSMGKFELAVVGFEDFLKSDHWANFNDSLDVSFWREQAMIEKQGCIFALQQEILGVESIDLLHLSFPMNTEFNDYAPTFFKNDTTLVFTSGRISSGSAMDNRFGESFTDNLRYAKVKKQWRFVKEKDRFEITNSKWNDGAGVFNATYDAYYFTRCGNTNDKSCKIYVSEFRNGVWKDPIILENINFEGFDSKQPAISVTNDTLYFVTDYLGGFGKNDIWMSVRDQNGKWQFPINLGPTINTPFNEISPYYHHESGAMFFASDGHQTMGGFDIYQAASQKNGGYKIINLGAPINSNADDAYFVLGKNYGYMSSNRKDGFGKFDIYSFNAEKFRYFHLNELNNSGRTWVIDSKLNAQYNKQLFAEREADDLYYETYGMDARNEFDVSMALKTIESEDLLDSVNFHIYLSKIPNEIRSRIETLRKKVLNNYSFIETNALIDTISVVIGMVEKNPDLKSKVFNIGGLVVDKLTGNYYGNKHILLSNDQDKVIKSTYTNPDGTFEFSSLEGEGFFKILVKVSRDQLQRANQLAVERLKLSEFNYDNINLTFEPIYFAFGKAEIENKSNCILDEIARYLNSENKLKVEIFAYTDSIGTSEFNVGLSSRRGDNVRSYLKNKGVSARKIVIRPMGEYTQTGLNIENDSIRSQFHRRVEFYINSGRKSFNTSFKTILTTKKVNIGVIPGLFNQYSTEIIVRNELAEKETIPAYTTLIVPREVKSIDHQYFYDLDKSKPPPP